MTLAGKGYAIVGVMPREFASTSTEIWLPAQINAWLMKVREARFYSGIGRLKPGITIAQARDDLARVQQRLAEEFPKTDKGWAVAVDGYKEYVVGSRGRELYLMFAAAGLLLLILCANVAGLMLGHLQRREREFAIRSSLGASRARLLGVILRETTWIGLLSDACGLILAAWGSQFLSRVFANLTRMQELHFDWQVVLFTIAASGFAALLFGLTPAFQIARRELNTILAQSSRSQAGGRRWSSKRWSPRSSP